MKGKARTFLWITAVAVAFLILAAAVGPFLIPAATYQRVIERELTRELDARVAIREFRFQLLPTPGYTIRDFSLISTSPPFQGMPLLTAKLVNGTLSFAALLRGRLETDIDARDVALDVRLAGESSNVARMFRIAGGASAGEAQAQAGSSVATPSGFAPLPTGPAPKEFRALAAPSIGPQAAPVGAPQPPPAPSAPAPSEAPPPVVTPAPLSPPTTAPSAAPAPAPQAPQPAGQPSPQEKPGQQGQSGQQSQQGDLRFTKNEPRTANHALRFTDLFVPTAYAAGGTASSDKAPAEAASALSIQSLRVLRGRVTLYPTGDAPPISIEGVELDAKRRGAPEGSAMDVRVAGVVAGEEGGPFGAQGQLILDRARDELTARQFQGTFRNAPFALEATAAFGITPFSIDLHLASPSLTFSALNPLLPLLDAVVPLSLRWEGTAAVDLTFKGTREAGEANLQIDASGARVLSGQAVVKEAGLPCKVTARAQLSLERWNLSEASLAFGSELLGLTGEVARDKALTSRLSLSGENLSLAALRILLPGLAVIGTPERLALELTATGGLAGAAPLAIEGKFRAARLESTGAVLEDLSGSFAREGDAFLFPTVRASFGGGQLSGNGSLVLSATPSFTFDAVVDRANLAALTTLRGGLSGNGSLVVKAQAAGPDAAALLSHLTLSGSLLAPEGTFVCSESACGAFSDETWAAITEVTTAIPDEETRKQIAAAGADFQELKAAFEVKEDALSLSDLTWATPLYAARLSATAAADGALAGEGALAVAASVAGKLFPDPAAQHALLAKDGTLMLPVKASGTLSMPKLLLDKERLTAFVVERQATKIPAPAPAKETKESAKPEKAKAAPQQAAPAKEKPPAPAAPASPAAPAPEKAAKPTAAKKEAAALASGAAPAPPSAAQKPAPKKGNAPKSLPLQDTDDVLKVIIGK